MRQMPRLRAVGLLLIATVLTSLAFPAPLLAQQRSLPARYSPAAAARAATFHGYFSRVHADPALAGGERLRLDGFGARVLQPLAAPAGAAPRSALLERLAVGGFVTYAPAADHGLTAWHYGAQADVSLLGRGPRAASVVEPLLSLGVGAFRAQRDGGMSRELFRAQCGTKPADLPLVAGNGGLPCGSASDRDLIGTHLALSPALAARAWLLPDVALRVDTREVIVYDGAPRHAFEVATGLSFTR